MSRPSSTAFQPRPRAGPDELAGDGIDDRDLAPRQGNDREPDGQPAGGVPNPHGAVGVAGEQAGAVGDQSWRWPGGALRESSSSRRSTPASAAAWFTRFRIAAARLLAKLVSYSDLSAFRATAVT
jgi:hypothetical protein